MPTTRSGSILAFLVAVFVACPERAYPNIGGSVSIGNRATGTFQASGVEQVTIDSEVLRIRILGESALVEVDYEMTNRGRPITVEAGFPSMRAEVNQGLVEQDDSTVPAMPLNPDTRLPDDLIDYSIRVDDQVLGFSVHREGDSRAPKPAASAMIGPDSEESGLVTPYWAVSSIRFNEGQARRVQVRYRARLLESRWCSSNHCSSGALYFRYLFSTGAVWKGPIAKGRVEITSERWDLDRMHIAPAGRFHREGDRLLWDFRDLEPMKSDDLVIRIRSEQVEVWKPSRAPETLTIQAGRAWDRLPAGTFRVTASSTLKDPTGRISYDSNILSARERLGEDVRREAWCEGVAGDGLGESLTFELDKPGPVEGILIVPGYRQSRTSGDAPATVDETVYFANNRVAEVDVTVNDAVTFRATLHDECMQGNEHWIAIAPHFSGVVTRVKIVIRKVHRGNRYRDTCVSLVAFMRRKASVPLESDGSIDAEGYTIDAPR